jgi:hypothetical protein
MDTIGLEQKAVELLDAMANKLGVGVDHFWPLFVREQMVSSWLAIGASILIILISIVIFVIGIRTKDDEAKVFCVIISILLNVPPIIIMCNNLPVIFNPEYHALKALMEMMK